MSFKTVLALIGIDGTEADIDKALTLSAELEAHLSVVIIRAAIFPLGIEYPVAAAWIEERQREIDELAKIRQRVEERCRKSGLSFEVHSIYDDLFNVERSIGMRCMYADVVVLGQGLRSDVELRRVAVAATAFDSGTPLLLMPRAGMIRSRPKTVLVAWNSRPQAANAAKAALEMLVHAATVHLVVVDPDSSYSRNGGEPGADMAACLSRHGCKVEVQQLSSCERPVEDILRQHAGELGCDMIVMGAYGHSRLRERIFGGVTAAILDDCAVPVFMGR